MNAEFKKIYEDLYSQYIAISIDRDSYRSPPNSYESDILEAIKESIDNAARWYSLRPDAKYFLMVNFHHLIIKPLLTQVEFRKDLSDQQKFEIMGDIIIIISASRNKADETDEISGHQIMRTIDRLWKDLSTTRLDIWG